jgi:hypothetical protein
MKRINNIRKKFALLIILLLVNFSCEEKKISDIEIISAFFYNVARHRVKVNEKQEVTINNSLYKLTEETEQFIYTIPSLSRFLVLNKISEKEKKIYIIGIYNEGEVVDEIYSSRLAIAWIFENEISIHYYIPDIKQKDIIGDTVVYKVMDEKYISFYNSIDIDMKILDIKNKSEAMSNSIEQMSTIKYIHSIYTIDRWNNEFSFPLKLEYPDYYLLLDPNYVRIYSVLLRCKSQEMAQLREKGENLIKADR